MFNGLFAQKQTSYDLIKLFKGFELDSVTRTLENDPKIKGYIIFKQELQYLKKGKIGRIDDYFERQENITYLDSVLYYNYLGDYCVRKMNPNDSYSFRYYIPAFEIAKTHKDTLLINESLRRINTFFLKNDKNKKMYQKYVGELLKYQKDEIDIFWKEYYMLLFNMSYDSIRNSDNLDFKNMEESLLNLKKNNTPNNTYFQGRINHAIGQFYSYPSMHDSSRVYFEKAYNTYSNQYFYSYGRKLRAKIALAIIDFRNKIFKEAITEFHELLNDEMIKKNIELKYSIYNCLRQGYEDQKKIDSSNFYMKLTMKYEDSIEYYMHIEKVIEFDITNEAKKTQQKFKKKDKEIMNLTTTINVVLPILAIIALIAIALFYYFKKYKSKSKTLETAQSETLEKIEELKGIVIKNYIILKDKTKVYISDLMYIKSEDHFIKLFLNNGKSHFVRGKISQIKEELPPNFIQSHRSYIINSNYIKQINGNHITLIDKTEIPLSRLHKGNFKDKP
ncbi:hypothetical protein IMCC3317_26700 [Kordia antarctica]|uniref:HTH LytTR-type domain-containing protein n=1 Tax=Kordia antarctica TaxID=1218801 RepID=A0A7L4ZL88_9FLAO|nr:hypothetical protein IMCC3317_26700 [Kordia antarctica]